MSRRSAHSKEDGACLLVTVDCGTASHEPLAEAARLGLDAVVLDHHQAPEALPEACAIVNPNRQDDLSGLGHLCAAGVVFLTLVALNRELRQRGFFAGRAEPDLLASLDLVALATVADVVPLTGLNRAFVRQGLIIMRRRQPHRPCRARSTQPAFPARRNAGISAIWSGRGSTPAAASATLRSALASS